MLVLPPQRQLRLSYYCRRGDRHHNNRSRHPLLIHIVAVAGPKSCEAIRDAASPRPGPAVINPLSEQA
jgi:hypothetical protein